MSTMTAEQLTMRGLLEAAGVPAAVLAGFRPHDLQCLINGGYDTMDMLRGATREGLRDPACNLVPSRTDALLSALQQGATAGGAASSSVPTEAGAPSSAPGVVTGPGLATHTGTITYHDLLVQISAQQQQISAQQQQISEQIANMEKVVGACAVDKIKAYVFPSTTQASTAHEKSFRNRVADYYGFHNERDKPQVCMLTNVEHDWHDLCAGHIVPRAAALHARVDLLFDVNNPRNGLLWSRVVEAAWSHGKFCFGCPAVDVFQFRLLDMELWDKRLQDYEPESKKLKSHSKDSLGELKWGELHTNKYSLQFTTPSRPYKRALCHMSKLQLSAARLIEQRRPSDVNSQASEFEYYSENGKLEGTKCWVNSLHEGLPSPELASCTAQTDEDE